jgi:hypothetical protein
MRIDGNPREEATERGGDGGSRGGGRWAEAEVFLRRKVSYCVWYYDVSYRILLEQDFCAGN